MAWQEGFATLCQKTHSEQAKWWLNGFWEEGAKEKADEVWDIAHKFIELDVGFPILYGGKMREYTETCDLDELKSHQILEKLGQTMTVLELRKRLKALDIDNNKRMALSEYLLDRYQKTPDALVNSPQGDVDPKELKAAEDAFSAAGAALDKAAADKTAAAAALLEAQTTAAKAASTLEASTAAAAAAAEALKVSEDAAAAAAESLKKQEEAEAAVRKAEAELQAVIDDITAQEQAKVDKIAKLQKIVDSDAGAVKKGKASNEIEQLKSEDSMPLRKAKITQKAALKNVEKERKKAEEATAAAAGVKKTADDAAADSAAKKQAADDAQKASEEAKKAADEAAEASAAAKVQAEEAHAAAEEAVKEAEAKLQEVKNSTGTPHGNIYWMEKTLIEKKKFMK